MHILNEKDYGLMEKLVSLSQRQLKQLMTKYLKKHYKNVIVTRKYLVAVGDIPIALVSHMDTVFKVPVKNLYYDKQKNVLWSPQGLGADDRAGVFSIIKIIQSGLRPSIILTTDEEVGGIGAHSLSRRKCPIPGLKYMIELDRRGIDDCVFYDCYNPEFTEYVETFGFKEQWGSFSDISFLMSAWSICGVNLSIGYRDEHSVSETLHVDDMFSTIEKVKVMLTQQEIPQFEYLELYTDTWNWFTRGGYEEGKHQIYGQHCSICKTLYSEYELFPVKGRNKKIKYVCPDCVVGVVDWCEYCGEAYEIEDPANKNICKECSEKLCTEQSNNNSKE